MRELITPFDERVDFELSARDLYETFEYDTKLVVTGYRVLGNRIAD